MIHLKEIKFKKGYLTGNPQEALVKILKKLRDNYAQVPEFKILIDKREVI